MSPKNGWFVESIITDKEIGYVSEFIEKEGKWFNNINRFIDLTLDSADTSDFTFQGIGEVKDIVTGTSGCMASTATNYDPTAIVDDGSCIFPSFGCMNIHAANYNPSATTEDGTCEGFGPFWMVWRDATPGFNNGSMAIAHYGTSDVFDYVSTVYPQMTFAWSTGASGYETTGLPLGPVALSITATSDNFVTQPSINLSSWITGDIGAYSAFVLTNYSYGCMDPNATNYEYSANAPCVNGNEPFYYNATNGAPGSDNVGTWPNTSDCTPCTY